MTSPQKLKPQLGTTILADVTAGVVVFLVALPLCLGVALASNAPLFSGLLAGIIGGILVGSLSGSHTSVSGPAAGLTAVVASKIALLGSFQAFTLAVLIAGVLQIVLGVVRAGSIADFVPSSVIKGLLASIGLILILKQVPHLLGHDADLVGEMSFQQPDQENTLSELAEMVSNIHPGAAITGLICLALLLCWERIRWLRQSPIPGPLVVVLFGVGLNLLFSRFGEPWLIQSTHLVQVPVADSLVGFFDFLQLPDFSAATNPKILTAAVTIALVASLETLLNLEAVDKLDPQKRLSPTNRELMAQGVGNMTAGLIGGLPVTSVIVRSSVNINSGGKTKLAAVIHGLLLLSSVALIPSALNLIPLSCLAAVLIVTGSKLAKPKLFKQMWREGPNQFLPFVITILAILFTDLLIGILIGLGFSILFILRSNLRRPLRKIVESHIGGEVLRIELGNQVSFLNRVALTKALDSAPPGGHVLIDARASDYIDADVQDLIWEYLEETAPARGVQVSLLGLKDHYEQLEDRVQYVDYTTREMQESLTPDRVQRILEEGNERFRNGQRLTRDLARQLEATAEMRHPLAIIFSGASSRTPVELIFDLGLGETYCARVTGNMVSEGVLGTLEYACAIAGAKLIVVMGHSNSAVARMAAESFVHKQAVTDSSGYTHLKPVIDEIQNSIDSTQLNGWHDLSAEKQQAIINDIYRRHVLATCDKIAARSSNLSALVDSGRVKVVGAMYDVRTGRVDFLDSSVADGGGDDRAAVS
jgi:carbonic anhydrase/SulP family sulfate permease